LILKVLKCSLEPPEQYPVGGIKSFFDLTKCELKMLKLGTKMLKMLKMFKLGLEMPS